MSKKFKTLSELENVINENFIRRRDELNLVKDLVYKNLKNDGGKVFAKQLIVLLYSHWEGFIKFSSECFIKFIHHQDLNYNELNLGMYAICKLDKINNFLESKIALKINSIKSIFDDYTTKAEIPYDFTISTYSNLNTETLEEICLIIGINEDDYLFKKGIIDEKLLKNRNKIAHGELVEMLPSYSLEIYNLVFPILENFKTDLLNRATLIKHSNKKT